MFYVPCGCRKIKEVKEADSKPAGSADQAAAKQAAAQPVPVAKEPEKPAIAPTKPLEPPPPELYSVGKTLLPNPPITPLHLPFV
jgi:hypothetical protein